MLPGRERAASSQADRPLFSLVYSLPSEKPSSGTPAIAKCAYVLRTNSASDSAGELNWLASHSGAWEPSSGAEDLRILGDVGSGGAKVESGGSAPGSGDVGAVFGRNLDGRTRRDMVLEADLVCFLIGRAWSATTPSSDASSVMLSILCDAFQRDSSFEPQASSTI